VRGPRADHDADGAPLRRRLLGRLDRTRDQLTPAAVRARLARWERRLGITRTGQIAIVGGVALWLLARVVAGTAIYLFAYGDLLLVGLAYVLAPRQLRLDGERTGLFPRVQEGDQLDVHLKLTATRRMTPFVIEERVPERLGRTVRIPVDRLAAGGTVTHNYSIRTSRRGVYQVGPLVAVGSDPLKLAKRETVVAQPFELLVHPRVDVVSDRALTRQLEDPPIRPPVSKPWPSGLEFYGMRDYTPGDDLRRIVWRASARTGKLMVREAEQGITDKITVILDTNRAYHDRDNEGLSESFEMGVRATASLAVRHLREGYEVKVVTNGGPLTRPARGPRNELMVLDALAKVEMSRDPLGGAIRQVMATGQRDAHNILVTPHLTPGDAGQLELLLRTGVSVLVVALLWAEDNTGGDNTTVLGVAASLGCQVVGIRPGQDLSTALSHDIGAGNRI